MHIIFIFGATALVMLAAYAIGYVAKISGIGVCLGFLVGMGTFAIWFRLKHGYWP